MSSRSKNLVRLCQMGKFKHYYVLFYKILFLLWINILDTSTTSFTQSSLNSIVKRKLSSISTSSESSIDYNDYSSDEYVPPFNNKNVTSFESNESIIIDNIETNYNTLNEQSIPNAEKNEFVQQIVTVQQNKRGLKKNEDLKTRKRLSNSKAWVRNVDKEKKQKALNMLLKKLK